MCTLSSNLSHSGLPVPLMSDNKVSGVYVDHVSNFEKSPPFAQDVFDMATFTKLYKVVPVKDTHKIRLTWILPPVLEHYKLVLCCSHIHTFTHTHTHTHTHHNLPHTLMCIKQNMKIDQSCRLKHNR